MAEKVDASFEAYKAQKLAEQDCLFAVRDLVKLLIVKVGSRNRIVQSLSRFLKNYVE